MSILKTIPLNHLKIQTAERPLSGILLHYLAVLLSCCLFALFFSLVWADYCGLTHTVVELACIFIALAAFFVVWHTYERISPVNILVGYGFLVVAVFDICHVYFFPELNLYPTGYYDLNTRYWILGRLAEALVLLLIVLKTFKQRWNKWWLFIIAIVSSTGISGLILYQPGIMPVLLIAGQGVTPAKIALEYLIIIIFLGGAIAIKDNLNDREQLTNRYIFLALLLAIPAELCFTVFTTVTDYYNTLGHVLKITYYYYLFRGIFVSIVTWPHAKLEKAGMYMTEILNGIPVGILTYDNKLKVTFANREAEKILACRLDSIRGLTPEQMFKKFLRDENINEPIARQVMVENAGPEINKLVTMENGRNKIFKSVFRARKLANGGAMIQLSMARGEQELENLQLQTQTVLDSIQDMALLLNRNHRVIMCNKALEKTLQVSSRDLLGLDINEVHNLLRYSVPVGGETGINSKDNPNETFREATLVTAGGQTMEVLSRMAPICNVDDEVIGYICTCSDVTGLKQEQQRTRQREKLALLGQMAAGIVHEIKNPLTSINGFNQLVMNCARDEKTKKYAGIIQTEVNALNKVVTDFLAFAKPRPPVFKAVSVNMLVISLQEMLESQLFIKGIKTYFSLAEDEIPVQADEGQLKQVILNIARNAMEAMQDTSGARLDISTRFNKDTQQMFISISDNGKGISPAEQHKLGTPFYSSKEKGTGLGLSICYQIVHEHGGSIDLQSEPGQGATFTISLPVKSKFKTNAS